MLYGLKQKKQLLKLLFYRDYAQGTNRGLRSIPQIYNKTLKIMSKIIN